MVVSSGPKVTERFQKKDVWWKLKYFCILKKEDPQKSSTRLPPIEQKKGNA